MDEIVQEFLVESHENLDQLDRDLLALERDPGNRDLLGSIFRTIHTIKGTSGFLAYEALEAVAHVGENLLSRLRDGELALTPEICSGLLDLVDAIRGLLAAIEADGAEGNPDHTDLIARLGLLASAPQAVALPEQRVGDEPMAADGQPEGKRSVADASIRVDVALLDSLMTMVGELVLTRNQIVQLAAGRGDEVLVRSSQRLNLIASELQECVMKTRMQPVDSIWQKIPRVVRDLALTCGKSVRVELQGRETDLDRTVLEATKDPLTHLVRNAVDHAIESPEDRVAAGKPEEGLLLLRAYHEGGQVNIEVVDDGKGIDPEVVGRKALEKGLVSADELAAMTPREITGLIFAPGFSTAAKVTNVSGRGVGMDVVKTNIEKIGGTIDVSSRVGHGTTFRIKIPLTLAIIPALTVRCAAQCYAIPQVNLLELVRLEGEAIDAQIEEIHGTPVFRLRGRLLPLVHLDEVLGVREDIAPTTVYIVVLQAEDRQFGLVVHNVLDTEEIVVKPLSPQLKRIHAYAGATILGDGRVALILDVLSVAQHANVLVSGRDKTLGSDAGAQATQAEEAEALLVVGVGEGRRGAVPLALVTRLESFDRSVIERVGSREVVQYRDEILPLVRVADHVGARSEADPAGPLQVVVYSEGERSVGLVVDKILDITRQTLVARSDVDDHGLLGSAVVQDKVTELLDLRAAIRAAGSRLALVEDAA